MLPAGPAAAGPRQPPRDSGRPNTTEVREWARAQGIEVKDHGRPSLPADLMVKFKSAIGQQG